MNTIIENLAKKTKKSEQYIMALVEEISLSLLKEGCLSDDPRFFQYLIRRIRKRLKIQESSTYKTFKQFFKEN